MTVVSVLIESAESRKTRQDFFRRCCWENHPDLGATQIGWRGATRAQNHDQEGNYVPQGSEWPTVIPGGTRTHFFDRFREQGIPLPDDQNLQDPATVAEAIVFAGPMPRESVLQELILTPLTETSWP